MTVASTHHRATYEDLLRLSGNNTMELVDGQVVEKSADFRSCRTEVQITCLFMAFVNQHQVALVLPASMGYQCLQCLVNDPDRMRKPDISVVQMERYRALEDANPDYMPIAPDLAVEVLSANKKVGEVNEKLAEYRTAGFPLVWVVDPEARTVTVYPNPGKPFIRSEDDELTAEHALPGFVCRVTDLFPPT